MIETLVVNSSNLLRCYTLFKIFTNPYYLGETFVIVP